MIGRETVKQHALAKGFQLKEVQLLSIENVLAKKDTVVIAKTGEGKSLIFQVATSVSNTYRLSTCVIVCPLVALMMDQVQHAESWGKSIFLGSAQNDKQAEFHLESYRFIFLSPEKLQQASTQRELIRIRDLISLFVIDEAHTCVTWQGFRPAFADIPGILQSIFDQRPPLLLMTATLPSAQKEQLTQAFQLRDETVFRVSCDRDNLSIQIINTAEKNIQLLQYARASQAEGNLCLIYVATPSDCHSLRTSLEIADAAGDHGGTPLRIRVYHGAGSTAKMQDSDSVDRTETLRLAASQLLDVCICTSAFGMGINIPNIDCVVNLVPPYSLAEYAQQIGRAGRNGNPAVAVMLFHPGKIAQCFSLWVADKSESVMQQNFVEFQRMMSFIYSSKCRRKFVRKMLEDVDEAEPLGSICNCDNCEETHIVQRDMAAAMQLLLSAIRHYRAPVCITRVADALFAHAPKHKGAWNDADTPMWGKGKELFAATKQKDIWASMAAVAVHELGFLRASLHHHRAPPNGHVVAYQRFSLTDAGANFLDLQHASLLIRERFVAPSAFQSVSARCHSPGCTNKALTAAVLCLKHSKASKPPPVASPQALTPQAALPSASQLAAVPASSPLRDTGDVLRQRDASQCTPVGYITQESFCSLPNASQTQDPQPPDTCYSKAGSYTFDLSKDTDCLYNVFMGATYTKLSRRTGAKTEVQPIVVVRLYTIQVTHLHFQGTPMWWSSGVHDARVCLQSTSRASTI